MVQISFLTKRQQLCEVQVSTHWNYEFNLQQPQLDFKVVLPSIPNLPPWFTIAGNYKLEMFHHEHDREWNMNMAGNWNILSTYLFVYVGIFHSSFRLPVEPAVERKTESPHYTLTRSGVHITGYYWEEEEEPVVLLMPSAQGPCWSDYSPFH